MKARLPKSKQRLRSHTLTSVNQRLTPIKQSRSQSPRYPCPAERENEDLWDEARGLRFPVPLDKGNEGSGNEIAN